ncbi:chain-length determining protein [Brevundimonas sp. LM2]|uniref:GumC family protein n=1 Tax=Brevundimonas sp. LM2 TaxID=1938605 RepID=UPI000983B3CF|nr:chain-length determining protein [Brevundimonas sp. LM2]AQR62217.1 chain-length determining protein [Brevundimonas sp. LM2]
MRSASASTYVSARPRYGVLDVIGLLFRELLLMVILFLVILALGTAAVLTLKKTYTAGASLFVGAGQEYVYQPRVGLGERQSTPPAPGEVAQAEANILGSREVKLRAVRALGLDFFQKPGRASNDPVAKQEGDAIKALNDGLSVSTTPQSSIIGLGFESDSAEKSARILNAVLDQYLIYRREVFQDRSTPAIQSQRRVFEDELADVDLTYESFLMSNDIGDFAASKVALAAVYQSTLTEKLSVENQLNQAARRLQTLVAQQAGTPAEVTLQQDLNVSAQDQILQLRTEREQLLARYQPGSQPVQDIEARIAGLQAYVASGTTVGAKEVRLGPNPVWTELETTRITTQAERDSLAARLGSVNRQLAEIQDRQARMTRLESENATLASNRDVLTANIRDFQQREAQSRADAGLVRAGADNVRVIERAAAPTRGTSLKAPLLALVILFAGFTALCVGLLRVFTRRGLATPAIVGRTLDMPVLAVAPMKA